MHSELAVIAAAHQIHASCGSLRGCELRFSSLYPRLGDILSGNTGAEFPAQSRSGIHAALLLPIVVSGFLAGALSGLS